MKKLVKQEKILLFLMTILFVLLNIFVICQKVNLHVDEVYTYGLANHPYVDTFNMDPEEGRTYEPGGEAWDEYMQVQDGHAFDYGNVWTNQEADVHPPFYYILVHTISSLFPGQYSIWFAGSVNVVFAAFTFLLVFFLGRELSGRNRQAFAIAGFFMVTAGILSAAAFMRMYIVAMFWVTFVSYLMVRWQDRKRGVCFYLLLFAGSVLGALTHYYFLIYLFFLCCVWGVGLLIKKQYADVVKFLATMALSGLSARAVFPAMVQHILSGHRGTEAMANLKDASASDYLERLSIFFGYINRQIFGGLLPVFAVLLAAAIVLSWKKKRHWDNHPKVWLLLLPCLAYFILVSKIAAYSYDRYIQPIYPVVVILGGYMICYVCGKLSLKKVTAHCTMAVLAVTAALGLFRCQWEYLYRESESLLEQAEKHAGSQCIYIYDWAWKAQPSFYEARNYESVTFISQDHLELLDEMELEEDGIVLCIMDTCEQEPVLEKLESCYGGALSKETIGQYFFSTSYYIYRQ